MRLIGNVDDDTTVQELYAWIPARCVVVSLCETYCALHFFPLPAQFRRQAIQTHQILFLHIVDQALGAFFGRPSETDVPLARVVVQRHAEAAGGLHEVDVGGDDLAGVGVVGEKGGVFRPLRGAGHDGKTFPIEAQDVGCALKGTKHKSDALVFQQVGGGFVAAADQIEVGDPAVRQKAETVKALGREVEVALGAQRGGGDKKQVLRLDESAVGGLEDVGKFSHGEFVKF